MEKKSPRLRTVDKVKPPFPLNKFPKDFGYKLGEELIFQLAVKSTPTLEGSEWEEIFAKCIGATWKPSNVGLDDVIMDNCAWGAKTVKSNNPSNQSIVRLISGRNSPVYSFDETQVTNVDPNHIGSLVLDIWNERVSAIRERYKHVRTVVLLKSNTLEEVVIFEFETIRYEPTLFSWAWNKNNNLEGFNKHNSEHVFTWQPHGSQFTIIEPVPTNKLIVNIRKPEKIDREALFKSIGFHKDWIEVKYTDE
jgi:hypothetical protein